jgi:hypothetical protein
MDNATFVASLTPDLRREILLTANEEFLASLPPEFVAEAQMLQERAVRNHHQAFLERINPEPLRKEEEGKEL